MSVTRQFLYVLTDETHVKVGRSDNVQKRIAMLQCGCPKKIVPVVAVGPISRVDAAAFENEMHRSMKKVKSHGEWFFCAPEAAVAAVAVRMFWFCGSLRPTYQVFGNKYDDMVGRVVRLECEARGCYGNERRAAAAEEVDKLVSCFD